MVLLEKHDLNFERSLEVNAGLTGDCACYTEINREKKRLFNSQTNKPSTSAQSPNPIAPLRSPSKSQAESILPLMI
jgi:hypothetical protein